MEVDVMDIVKALNISFLSVLCSISVISAETLVIQKPNLEVENYHNKKINVNNSRQTSAAKQQSAANQKSKAVQEKTSSTQNKNQSSVSNKKITQTTPTQSVSQNNKTQSYQNNSKITVAERPYADFVANLSNEVIDVKRSKLSEEVTKIRFIMIAEKFVAIESLAKFFLASKYRTLNNNDKQKFIKCVTNLIATRLLAELPHGEFIKTKITDVKTLPNKHWLVTAEYVIDNTKHYTVVFSVFDRKNGPKIFDIIINEVSASKIQRADIDGKIAKDGFQKFLTEFFNMYGN